MHRSRGLAIGGHDDHFLIIDRVGVDYVVSVRAPNGDALGVYLRSDDIDRIMDFFAHKDD